MRLAMAGKLVMVGSYHYDEMSGQEISKKEIPVRFSTGYGDFVEGQCNLREHDFTSHSGYATVSNDGFTAHLGVHSNCHFDLRMADGSVFNVSRKSNKAQRPENQRMQAFLAENGIDATPKYLPDGSLRGCWRLYNDAVSWSEELAGKLNALGFTDFDGKPLGRFSGNGGSFSVFVRGHNELLEAA